LRKRSKPTRVKHLLGALPWGSLKALLTNIKLGWRGLTGTNTLAYFEHFEITAEAREEIEKKIETYMSPIFQFDIFKLSKAISFNFHSSKKLILFSFLELASIGSY
jgi:hypothetical protein